jgi:hypothetical protein
MSVLQRDHWTEPAHLGEGFRLHKERCGRELEAVRNQDALLDLTERWKAAMMEKGWR